MMSWPIQEPKLETFSGRHPPGGGDSHMEETAGMLVGNLTPKGDHLGVAQAFCGP